MFVMNCRIKTETTVRYEEEGGGKGGGEGGEAYHPVVCESCGTELAMQDEDEVVHFFNVIAS